MEVRDDGTSLSPIRLLETPGAGHLGLGHLRERILAQVPLLPVSINTAMPSTVQWATYELPSHSR